MKKKIFSITDSNIAVLYDGLAFWAIEFFAVMLLAAFGAENFMYVSEILMLVIFVPVFIYARMTDVKLTEAFRIKGFSVKDLFLTLALCVCGYIVITALTSFVVAFIYAIGGHMIEYPGLEDIMQGPVWYTVLSMVIIAPLFEEFLMRGVVLSGHRNQGTAWAVIMSGLIFGLMHGDFLRFFPTGVLGMFLAIVVLGSDSWWLAVVYHAVHNAFASTGIIDTYVLQLPWELNLMPATDTAEGMMMYGLYTTGLTIAAIIFTALILRSFIKRIPKLEKPEPAPGISKKTGALVAGIVLLAIRAMVTFPQYFM